ncbi:hypothetical protein MHC_04260 [Mycoplasma haemocanis str. Illinois]|uniref:Uncharacterized protein n=1 Tax=Mycoplasma haemocanis (strain Illinois) TaxID=1111676 RepID=H6N7T6_MYCHN|nr:hypothetical protein [Mycoplasma haemocanis]AEW45708.1 hypothetical protein MHC_04260 [Mycoplasma haemocanis str. Illinois]
MKTLSIVAVAGISVAGIGGWYKFHHLKPKTLREYLEWQGFRLLSDAEENYWKAILDENGELIVRLSLNSNTEDLKQWCRNNLEVRSYDHLISTAVYLCADKPRTVKSRMIQLYGSADGLISSDDDYKVAYLFRKHIKDFHNLIGYTPIVDNNGREKEDLEKAKNAFKQFCVDSLGKPAEDTLVRNVKTLCTPKGFSSIEDLIRKRGEASLLLTENDKSSQLEQKYQSIKDLKSWMSEGKLSNSSNEDLKAWCYENKGKKFSDKDVFSEIYPKFRYRCLDEQVN